MDYNFKIFHDVSKTNFFSVFLFVFPACKHAITDSTLVSVNRFFLDSSCPYQFPVNRYIKRCGWSILECNFYTVFQLLFAVKSRRKTLLRLPRVSNRTKIQWNSVERLVFDWARQSNKIEHLFCCEFDFRTNRTKSN